MLWWFACYWCEDMKKVVVDKIGQNIRRGINVLNKTVVSDAELDDWMYTRDCSDEKSDVDRLYEEAFDDDKDS